jgi:hypothetical protein
MPVDLVEYFHAWCDECDWTDDNCGSYEAAGWALDDHIQDKH